MLIFQHHTYICNKGVLIHLPLYMNLTLLGEILLILFSVCALIQLLYLVFQLPAVGFSMDNKGQAVQQPVSVIICARNELKNLRTFLPSILEQDYPKYQVVVVNDCSWDESAKYLEEMADAYPHLKIVTIKEQEKYPHGKKLALTLGIKGADHELLLMTDADCKPASSTWIKETVSQFTEGKDIVIGYGAYQKENGLLNKWIRFDTVYNALFFLGRAMKGKAYMGVGRNLAYRKSLFFANKGFANHYHIMSGDDDLFVNETATTKNTSVSLSPESFTYSKPKTSWTTWMHQKRRHMSTGVYYNGRDQRYLGAWFLSLSGFYIFAIILIILKQYPEVIVSMFAIRLIIQMIVFGKGMQKLKENDLIWLTPLFDAFTAFSYPVLSVSSLVIKTKTWK
jgi:poly-beta-1,6-N-acetyl-D-glucosamine synthase